MVTNSVIELWGGWPWVTILFYWSQPHLWVSLLATSCPNNSLVSETLWHSALQPVPHLPDLLQNLIPKATIPQFVPNESSWSKQKCDLLYLPVSENPTVYLSWAPVFTAAELTGIVIAHCLQKKGLAGASKLAAVPMGGKDWPCAESEWTQSWPQHFWSLWEAPEAQRAHGHACIAPSDPLMWVWPRQKHCLAWKVTVLVHWLVTTEKFLCSQQNEQKQGLTGFFHNQDHFLSHKQESRGALREREILLSGLTY